MLNLNFVAIGVLAMGVLVKAMTFAERLMLKLTALTPMILLRVISMAFLIGPMTGWWQSVGFEVQSPDRGKSISRLLLCLTIRLVVEMVWSGM